jgi:2-oxoglutarate dehydrogenase E2 component (dihydrolipoamide succinyltransferase)
MSKAPSSLGERIALEVPPIGESVTEVQVGAWRVAAGSAVKKDQILVELESDKATVELPAPADGVLEEIFMSKGAMAGIGEAIGVLRAGAAAGAVTPAPASNGKAEGSALPGAAAVKPAAAAASSVAAPANKAPAASAAPAGAASGHVMPSAARLMAETNTPRSAVEASGPGGRVLKEDVQRAAQAASSPSAAPAAAPAKAPSPASSAHGSAPSGSREEERVPMSMLRRKIAQNLVQAQQNAALLTTFNEIDMGAVKALREEHQSAFEAKFGVRLGFMSIFVKAAVDALRLIPAVNAEIQGDQIVYRHYQDIGVAVGGGKGLVVPVIRNAERLSFAEIELKIADFGKRAKDNKLSLEELTGGTFTISNGGIYGSLLSTPIVNPPQSGILGLHAIQDRPVARDGQVVIRPMMYVALTYDHRLVDGREAVTFLKRIKECVENPARMLLEV